MHLVLAGCFQWALVKESEREKAFFVKMATVCQVSPVSECQVPAFSCVGVLCTVVSCTSEWVSEVPAFSCVGVLCTVVSCTSALTRRRLRRTWAAADAGRAPGATRPPTMPLNSFHSEIATSFPKNFNICESKIPETARVSRLGYFPI